MPVAKLTCRVAGHHEVIYKGKPYPANHPIVRDRPDLFEDADKYADDHAPKTDTKQLGDRSMSQRVEQATAAPGERRNVRKRK